MNATTARHRADKRAMDDVSSRAIVDSINSLIILTDYKAGREVVIRKSGCKALAMHRQRSN